VIGEFAEHKVAQSIESVHRVCIAETAQSPGQCGVTGGLAREQLLQQLVTQLDVVLGEVRENVLHGLTGLGGQYLQQEECKGLRIFLLRQELLHEIVADTVLEQLQTGTERQLCGEQRVLALFFGVVEQTAVSEQLNARQCDPRRLVRALQVHANEFDHFNAGQGQLEGGGVLGIRVGLQRTGLAGESTDRQQP
jgi:hypothetical protein